MRKDIEIPEVEGVYMAVVHEWNEEFLSQDWNVYLVNDTDTVLEMALVVTRGYDEERKTSLLRHAIGEIAPKSAAKVEVIQEELLQMNNEFSVTFFKEGKLYDKKYLFRKNTINEKAFQDIPSMEQRGVLVK